MNIPPSRHGRDGPAPYRSRLGKTLLTSVWEARWSRSTSPVDRWPGTSPCWPLRQYPRAWEFRRPAESRRVPHLFRSSPLPPDASGLIVVWPLDAPIMVFLPGPHPLSTARLTKPMPRPARSGFRIDHLFAAAATGLPLLLPPEGVPPPRAGPAVGESRSDRRGTASRPGYAGPLRNRAALPGAASAAGCCGRRRRPPGRRGSVPGPAARHIPPSSVPRPAGRGGARRPLHRDNSASPARSSDVPR